MNSEALENESNTDIEKTQEESKNPVQNIQDAISVMKSVLALDSDLDYYTILLFVAHTYMRGYLPSEVCLYLAFDGPKSSGKTTATKMAIYLSYKGEFITSITPSALKRLSDKGATLGIDEIDAQAHNNEVLETILRMGNSWDAKGRFSEPRGNTWEVVQINIGGPKIFNFRGEVDDALRSRCMVIGMPSSKDLELIINVMFYEDQLSFVKDWVESAVRDRLDSIDKDCEYMKMDPQDYIKSDMQSKNFRERLVKINPTLSRGLQQAVILVEISDIMEWDLEEAIKEIVESQICEDPFETHKEIIADWWSNIRQTKRDSTIAYGGDIKELITIGSEDLRGYLNIKLGDKKQREISKHQFAILKRELGFKEGLNAKKSSMNRGKLMLHFDEIVLINLGLEGRF
ncbi:MAG: hypothetical protein ACTSPB_05440 [Candidatus Thorarchaeota archaeon]